MLSKTKKAFHFDTVFWKKFVLATVEFLSLFFISSLFLGFLEGFFSPKFSLVWIISLFVFFFFLVFALRSLLFRSFSSAFYFSLLDTFAIFSPFVFDFNLSFVRERIKIIQGFWPYSLGAFLVLWLILLIADLKMKRERNLLVKTSWKRISRPGMIYLSLALALFMVFGLFVYNSMGREIFSENPTLVLKASQPLIKVFFPKFNPQMSLKTFSIMAFKKNRSEELSLTFSRLLHQRISPSSKMADILSLYFSREMKAIRKSKKAVFGLFLTIFSLLWIALRFISYFVSFLGRPFLEMLIAFNFFHRHWLKTTKEEINF